MYQKKEVFMVHSTSLKKEDNILIPEIAEAGFKINNNLFKYK
jgi:hypothetical protein